MQMQTSWIKPAVWGAVLGIILTMIVGFNWMGWMLGATAERLATERAEAAVVTALTPSCVSRFMQQPGAPAKLKELQATESWRQREFVEAGGWATSSGAKDPTPGLASACADLLSKTKA